MVGHTQNFVERDIFPGFQKPIKYPALTPDGNYLIFLSDDGTALQAYESSRTNGKWSAPAPFEYINKLMEQTSAEAGGFSFNHDGMVLYFHAKIASNYFDIFFSRKTAAGWGAPQRLGKPVSMDANLFSPAISSDNKTLFVLREKTSANKKLDVCKELLLFEKNRNGEWVGPKYLPDEFNIGCQETPFFCADNNKLFFASKRVDEKKDGKKISDEDYNIYFARRIDENNWFYPVYVENLSSEYNDLSPMLNSAGNYFLMSVKAKNIKKQPQKIYTATLPSDTEPDKTFVLSGTITDLYSKKPVEAKIVAQDAITAVPKGEFFSTDEGQYSIILTKGTFYNIDFSKENYSHTFYYKDLTSIGTKTEETVDIALYDNVNLELNIYDGALFYPVSPKIVISDSLTGQPLPQTSVVNVSKGKYNCNLSIGHLYKIKIESENYKPYSTSFDLRTDVVYSNFEKSLELEASRKRLTLNVKNKDGASVLPVNVKITNTNRDEDLSTMLSRDEADNPVLLLRTNDKYELNITKKGFTYFNTELSFPTTAAQTMDIVLDALTAKTRMIFNNITFETNSAELNSESFSEVYRIVEFMKDNPDLRIEISAHTDDVGSQEYNARLSDKRAASVVIFLIKNNVAKERLQPKGYGKLQPIVPNDTDENRAKNRRVEIRIIE
jgi:outer membrane protein OmpA-like peptidoglycan-associated protein